MGKMEAGIMMPFRGKVGNFVGYTTKGKSILRYKGPSKRNNKSPKQLIQQAKFTVATAFVKNMANLFKVTFKNYTQRMTARNHAVSQIVTEAMAGVYPNYVIDYSKVKISQGGLEAPMTATTTSLNGTLHWSWDYNGAMDGNPMDRAILVVYVPFYRKTLYKVFGEQRSGATDNMSVPAILVGQPVYTWLAFISEDGTQISDSIFTGQLAIA